MLTCGLMLLKEDCEEIHNWQKFLIKEFGKEERNILIFVFMIGITMCSRHELQKGTVLNYLTPKSSLLEVVVCSVSEIVHIDFFTDFRISLFSLAWLYFYPTSLIVPGQKS